MAEVLRHNQLQLFDADGSDRTLDANRHLDAYVPRRWGHQRTRRALVQATVELFGCWALHLLKSSYARPWFGGVTIRPAWLRDGSSEPPAVILRNSPVAVGPLTETDDDLGFVWRYASSVGPIAVKRLGSEKDWVYWICLAGPPY